MGSGSCERFEGGDSAGGRPYTFHVLLEHNFGVTFIATKDILPLVLEIPLILNCHVLKPQRTAGRAVNLQEGRERAQRTDCGVS